MTPGRLLGCVWCCINLASCAGTRGTEQAKTEPNVRGVPCFRIDDECHTRLDSAILVVELVGSRDAGVLRVVRVDMFSCPTPVKSVLVMSPGLHEVEVCDSYARSYVSRFRAEAGHVYWIEGEEVGPLNWYRWPRAQRTPLVLMRDHTGFPHAEEAWADVLGERE